MPARGLLRQGLDCGGRPDPRDRLVQPDQPPALPLEPRQLADDVSAGEAAGAQSIWGVIRALHVERIGHGTHAEQDPVLLDYLAEHQIPLEMCPISNVKTGAVPSLQAHPVRRYFERGILVTRLWYIRSVDPQTVLYTGLTRDGTFLIEKGKITEIRFKIVFGLLGGGIDYLTGTVSGW